MTHNCKKGHILHLLSKHILNKVSHLSIMGGISNVMKLAELVEVELLQRQCQLHCMQSISLFLMLVVCLWGCQVGQLGATSTHSLHMAAAMML